MYDALQEAADFEIIRITVIEADTGHSTRYLCYRDAPHAGYAWYIELPQVEYTPQLFDKITVQARLDESNKWHVYFRFKSAPWIEVKAVW
jgi:hypothetical protein